MRTQGVWLLLVLAIAGPAQAQSRKERQLSIYRDDMQSCVAGAAARASGRAEATRDTVADAAAKVCEGAYIKQVTGARLMDRSQAQAEINAKAYQMAERVLSSR